MNIAYDRIGLVSFMVWTDYMIRNKDNRVSNFVFQAKHQTQFFDMYFLNIKPLLHLSFILQTLSVYVVKLVEKKNGPWRFKTLFGFLQILSLLLLQEEKFENSVFITLNEFSEAVIYPYQIYHHHYIKTMAMSFISLKCDWNFYP